MFEAILIIYFNSQTSVGITASDESLFCLVNQEVMLTQLFKHIDIWQSGTGKWMAKAPSVSSFGFISFFFNFR